MGDPGELQCCPALWTLQRKENKDKFRKELMREAHLRAFNFSRIRLPKMWVFVHLTWLVWVFMKCLLEPQKPNSRLTQICCHVTALRIATAVCTRPYPCDFSAQNSLAFQYPKVKDTSKWMLGTTTQIASASVSTSPYLSCPSGVWCWTNPVCLSLLTPQTAFLQSPHYQGLYSET